MALSSNSIIHFTKTKDSLKGILGNNFNISYCKESFQISDENYSLMVPMVSFCDIPLSEVKNHINKYGSYGIGFTKEWAEKQGLNPVLYLERHSNLSANLVKAFDKYIRTAKNHVDVDHSILDIFRYIKNYQANLSRGGHILNDYRFSDEREWRYVPSLNNTIGMCLPADFFESDKNRKQVEVIKKELSSKKLHFEPNDVKYIIIDNDDEISEFLEHLKHVKGKKYSYHDIERLMTRILTSEQIKNDI